MTKHPEIYPKEKVCTRCKINLSIDAFTKLKPRKNRRDLTRTEKSSGPKFDSWCKECRKKASRERSAKRKKQNPKSNYYGVEAKDVFLVREIRYRLNFIKSRCKLKDLDYDLDPQYMLDLMKKQDCKCALVGLPFDFTRNVKHELGPSVDKIDPKKGYVKGNVQWLSWAANRAKGEMTNDNLISMARRIVEQADGKS